MKLANLIGSFQPERREIKKPYLIAEAGVNHEGSMDIAKRLIAEAAEGGAHAIKFQTYKAGKIASKNSPSYWDLSKEPTTSQYELFKKYDSFWKTEYETLKTICDNEGIEFLSTPFDVESAAFLNDMMDVFKISSSDISNLPFIDYICTFGKPVLLSTGASYLWEIQRAVEVIERNKTPYSLMHCILNYPTANNNANLGMIKDLIFRFPTAIPGYSDHTLPEKMDTLIQANLLGAIVLEKHFTFDKTLPGNDHYHAMDHEDIKFFFKKIDSLYSKLGSFSKAPIETEGISRLNARRSLIASKNIAKGEVIEYKHLTWKRPAYGISPADIDVLIGQAANQDIDEDTVLQWSYFVKQD